MRPKFASPARLVATKATDWVYWLAIVAVFSQLMISSNLMRWAGIPYNAPGGLPIWKFHVGTYLAFCACALQAIRQPHPRRHLIERIARQPHYPLAAGCMLACAVSSGVLTGLAGASVIIENFLSALVLAFVMDDFTAADRRQFGRAMLWLIALNVVLCLGESAFKSRLIPIILTAKIAGEAGDPDLELIDVEGEFRGTALYDHPLTGALMTMMGVFLCLASDLRPRLKVPLLILLLLGLIAFGGRTAMVVTYTMLMLMAAVDFMRRLIGRRMDTRYLGLAFITVVFVPALLLGTLLETSLGERIAARMYADDSAQARVVQWLVLSDMTAGEHVFGLLPRRLLQIVTKIGLEFPFTDIENFWLLLYINLGLVGFLPWLAGFFIMLRRLTMSTSTLTRLLLLAVILVASTSNSLGRKSNVMIVTVAAAICTAAFRKRSVPHGSEASGDGADERRGLRSLRFGPVRPIADVDSAGAMAGSQPSR